MTPHTPPDLHLLNFAAPAVAAAVFIALMSLMREPARQQLNAILLAGAGAAYLNGGLGPWELAYLIAATPIAYRGLSSYRFIAIGWWMHACWDVVHHLYATPIWPWSPTSSAGCAVFDSLIAIWFLRGAPASAIAGRYQRWLHPSSRLAFSVTHPAMKHRLEQIAKTNEDPRQEQDDRP